VHRTLTNHSNELLPPSTPDPAGQGVIGRLGITRRYVDGGLVVSAGSGTLLARTNRREHHGNHGRGGAALPDFRPDRRKSLEPDVLVVRREDVSEKCIERPLQLAVEVLSPTTRRQDQLLKRGVYEDAGVASYWIFDPKVPSLPGVRAGRWPVHRCGEGERYGRDPPGAAVPSTAVPGRVGEGMIAATGGQPAWRRGVPREGRRRSRRTTRGGAWRTESASGASRFGEPLATEEFPVPPAPHGRTTA
jgi:hypothetical protein